VSNHDDGQQQAHCTERPGLADERHAHCGKHREPNRDDDQ